MLRKLVVFIWITGVSFSACSTPQETVTPFLPSPYPTLAEPTLSSFLSPTPTCTPKSDLMPTPMLAAATSTPAAAELQILLPTGKAAKEWKGIPVMPNAFAAEESADGKSYRYTIKGNITAIQNYYNRQLTLLGWNLLSAGAAKNDNQIIIFTKGRDVLSVSIILIDETERIVMVMLVLS